MLVLELLWYTHFASLRRYSSQDYSPYCGGVVINYGTHCLGSEWARIANEARNPVVFINPWFNDVPSASPNPADDSVLTGQFPPIAPAANSQNAVVFRTTYGTWYHPSFDGYSTGGASANPPFDYDKDKYCKNHNDVANTPKAGTANGVTAGTNLRLVGFGATTPGGDMQRNLKQGDFPLLSLATCNSSALYSGWDGAVAQTPDSYKWFPWTSTNVNNVAVRANSMICAGGAGYPVASCTGDSGGPVFIPDPADNPNADQVVGLVSYGKYYDNNDRLQGCNYKPRFVIRYTMDIFLYDDINKRYYTGTFPFSVQKKLSAYITWLIAKKPTMAGTAPRNRGGPFDEVQVNYYSYKGADKNGRLRFKWTSKKPYEQVSKYFQTGSYNATCDNKGIFDFEGAKNCTQGPFSSAIWKNAFWQVLSPTMSYYKNALTDMQKIIQKGIDDEDTVQLTIKNIEVWNGYGTKPNCVAGSGVNACKRLIRFCTNGLPDNT
ncbi:hypothetical protein ABPG77_000491 [Micractinium sp. CCAP 211/92]